MRIPIFLLSLLFITKESFSQTRWTKIYTDIKGNNFYIDSMPLANHNGIIQIWLKENIKQKYIEGKSYTNVTANTLMSFDCDLRKTVLISEAYYKSDGSKIMRKVYKEDETDWENVEPETILERLLLIICEKFKH